MTSDDWAVLADRLIVVLSCVGIVAIACGWLK